MTLSHTGETVQIAISDDSLFEPTESFALSLSQPTGGAAIGTINGAAVSILSDDANPNPDSNPNPNPDPDPNPNPDPDPNPDPTPGVISFGASQYQFNENGQPLTQITLLRSGDTDGAVTVQLTLSSGTASTDDYVALSETISFASAEKIKTIPISITNDLFREADVSFSISLSNPSDGLVLGSIASSTVTTIDDDTPQSPPLLNWSFQTDSQRFHDAAIDQSGHLITVGWENFGSSGPLDTFVAVYDKAGNLLWKRLISRFGDDYSPKAVATDSDNNIFVLLRDYPYDTVVAKLDAQGNQLWVKKVNSNGNTHGRDISIDAQGNFYITGTGDVFLPSDEEFPDNPDLSESTGTLFIAKYDTNGNRLWSEQFGSDGNDTSTAITTDNLGNVYITGQLDRKDAFLTKYSSNGSRIWFQQFGFDSSTVNELDVDVDSQGNAYVAGTTHASLNNFLAKYDTNGTQVWLQKFDQHFDSPPFTHGFKVTVDQADNIYLSGSTFSDLTGIGIATTPIEGGGYFEESDAFLAKYTPEGNILWLQQFGSTPPADVAAYNDTQDILSISTSKTGEIYVVGNSWGTAAGPAWVSQFTESSPEQRLMNVFNHVKDILQGGDESETSSPNAYSTKLGSVSFNETANGQDDPYRLMDQSLDALLNGTLSAIRTAKTVHDLNTAASQLKSFAESSGQSVDQLMLAAKTLLTASYVPSLRDDLQSADFIEALSLLAQTYADLQPSSASEPTNFFLDTLWQAQDATSSSKAANELDAFFKDVQNPLKLVEVNQKVLGAVKQVTPSVSLSTDLLAQISLISAKYAAFNPDASGPLDPGTGFFLDTFWNGGEASLEKGIDEFEDFIDSFGGSEKDAIQFLNNLFDTAAAIPEVKNNSEAFRQFVGLANAYAKLEPETFSNVDQPDNFFLKSIWDGDISKSVSEFSALVSQTNAIQNTLGIIEIDRILALPRLLTQTINQARSSFENILSDAFISSLTNFSLVYASLDPREPEDSNTQSQFFLHQLWEEISSSPQEFISDLEITTYISKFVQEFEEFIGDLGNTPNLIPEFLNYSTKILRTVSQVSSLKDAASNVLFIEQFLDLARGYFQLSTASELPESGNFLSEIFRAGESDNINLIANQFQNLIDSLIGENGQVPQIESSATITETFVLPNSDNPDTQIGRLVLALENSDYGNSILSPYTTFNVASYNNEPDRMVLVSTADNSIGNNTVYPNGAIFPHTTIEGYTYPYVLVLRDGQLIYFSVGDGIPLYPGDKVLLPLSNGTIDGEYLTFEQTEPELPISLIQDFLSENVVAPLYEANQTLGQFALGALYQFGANQSEPLTQILSLHPDLQQWFDQAEEGTEQILPDTAALYAGRIFGDGLAAVVSVLEIALGIVVGTGGTVIGGGISLTGAGSVVGVPAAVASATVGAGLIVQGANSAAAAAESIFENTATLMAIIGGQGGQSIPPQPGDPVPGIQGAVYRKSKNNSTRQEDIDYEVRVTGKFDPDLAVRSVNDPTEFDWYDGTTFLDAKNWSDGGINDISIPNKAFRIPGIVKDARRQIEAIKGTGVSGIEWRVKGKNIANALRSLFEREEITITIRQVD